MSLFTGVSEDIRTSADSGALNNTTTSLTFGIRGSDGFLFRSNNYIVAWNESTYPDPANDPNARIGLLTDRSSQSLTVTWGSFDTPVTALSGTPTIAQLFRNSDASVRVISESYPKTRSVTKTVSPPNTVADNVVSSTAAEVQINSAINSANSSGGGVVSMRSGTYTQSTGAHILPKSNVILQGEGKATNIVLAIQKVVKIDQQSNVRLRDFLVDATANSAIADLNTRRNTFAIYIDRSNDVTVKDVNVETHAYGIFLTDQTTSTTNSRFRFLDCTIHGACQNDLIGGGPGTDGATVSEIVVDRCFIKQDATMTNAGTYLNAIDIVAQQKTIITNNITYGGILLGGEKIPHLNVNVLGNIVHAPAGIATGSAVGQIAILCASNTTPQQSADSTNINIIGNQITSGNIFVQGQSATSNRTRKVTIASNNIINNASADYPDHTYGINLNYVANVSVQGNTVDGAVRGIYLNNTDSVDISNNTFINCTTPIVLASTNTKLTGHNNIGINPDCLYAGGNITGATSFSRVNGIVQTFTFTGSVTATVADGFFVGDTITREFTMGGSGSYTYTRGSNEKLVGGSFVPTTSVGAKDTLTQRWDGTNWVEVGRALNIS